MIGSAFAREMASAAFRIALTPTTRLGRYLILGPLGAGGMGKSTAAVTPSSIVKWPSKYYQAALARDRERLTRFERVAKAPASPNHARRHTRQ